MNQKASKRIRKALSYDVATAAQYEQPKIHHLSSHPVFEQHTRTLRSWDTSKGKIVSRDVTKIRYGRDGKTPIKPLLTKEGESQTQIVPVAQPIRLTKDCPRAVYKLMKRLERRVGLDAVYDQIVAEAA